MSAVAGGFRPGQVGTVGDLGFMAQLVRPAAGGQPERRVAYVPLALHPSHERTISGRRVIGELGEAAAAAGAAAGAGVAAPSIVVSRGSRSQGRRLASPS